MFKQIRKFKPKFKFSFSKKNFTQIIEENPDFYFFNMDGEKVGLDKVFKKNEKVVVFGNNLEILIHDFRLYCCIYTR